MCYVFFFLYLEAYFTEIFTLINLHINNMYTYYFIFREKERKILAVHKVDDLKEKQK